MHNTPPRLAVAIASLALLRASPSAANPPHAATRTVSAGGWSYDVPARWTDVPPPLPSVLSAARDTAMVGGMAANVNLNREAFAGDGLTYARAAVEGITHVAHIDTQRPVTYGGLDGLLVEATWTGGQTPYRTMQFLTAAGGYGYVLTCTASRSAYASVAPTCRAALASFHAAP